MSEWHIRAMKPTNPPEPNPQALVKCKIMEIPGGYVFVGPKGGPHSIAPGHLVEEPFEFPVFQALLSGSNDEPWFITVEKHVPGEDAWGYASNSGFRHGPGLGQDDPDTWVAHAGATVEEGEGKDAAAASA